MIKSLAGQGRDACLPTCSVEAEPCNCSGQPLKDLHSGLQGLSTSTLRAAHCAAVVRREDLCEQLLHLQQMMRALLGMQYYESTNSAVSWHHTQENIRKPVQLCLHICVGGSAVPSPVVRATLDMTWATSCMTSDRARTQATSCRLFKPVSCAKSPELQLLLWTLRWLALPAKGTPRLSLIQRVVALSAVPMLIAWPTHCRVLWCSAGPAKPCREGSGKAFAPQVKRTHHFPELTEEELPGSCSASWDSSTAMQRPQTTLKSGHHLKPHRSQHEQ